MKIKNFTKATAVLALALSTSYFQKEIAQAASDTAQALQVVQAAIAIAQVSDLDFGTAVQGDAASTVAPGTAENANNASFAVTGEPGLAYTITLPADGAVVMQTGGGGANETIAVNTFVSNPAAGANELLNGTGNQSLFVGATRAALGAAQVAGAYATTFTVDVVY
jgi:spore coat protein U-like protein